MIKSFIEKYNLTGTFIVAFSGGYDSMCLLDMLYKTGYKDIIAIHLNHNWRGAESLSEVSVCEEFANARGIRFYTETLNDNIPKTETAAREARYEFFKKCAKKFNSNVVFTAHNFDDNVETVLYRIIKGTGIVGLQGIAEHRDIFYRPLLTTKREYIEKYCKDNNLSPNKDSSNENIKYKRNLIRKKIIPILKEINPKVSDAINSLSELARENNPDKQNIREMLIEHNIDYDRKKIEQIYDFINNNKNSKSGKTLSIAKNLWLFVNNKTTQVITKSQKSAKELVINTCGDFEFEDFIFSIKPYTDNVEKFPSNSDFKAYINIQKIDFVLRHRKDGDKIHPLGCKGTQKIKKYLNEKKIPNHQKDKLVCLCQNSEVFWCAGIGINEKIKVIDKPTHIIELRGKNENKYFIQ